MRQIQFTDRAVGITVASQTQVSAKRWTFQKCNRLRTAKNGLTTRLSPSSSFKVDVKTTVRTPRRETGEMTAARDGDDTSKHHRLIGGREDRRTLSLGVHVDMSITIVDHSDDERKTRVRLITRSGGTLMSTCFATA